MKYTKSSNDLRYTKSLTINGYIYNVSIRLNDECKNGHQDFSITGDIYRIVKNGRKVWESGGCLHDMILQRFPQFQKFIQLHLCDYTGVPMHPVANGFYHLTNGFNSTKTTDEKFENEYCSYYRITPKQYAVLSTSRNQVQFAMHLKNLGILAQWKTEANLAIEALEELTQTNFIIDSKRTQYIAPTEAEIADEIEKQNSVYYSPEQEAQRELQRIEAEFKELYEEYQKNVSKCTEEYEVKKEILKVGGAIALRNCIFYNHSKTVSFNWSYNKLDETLLNDIISKLKLPDGVTAEISKK